jgi:hypothetical protein
MIGVFDGHVRGDKFDDAKTEHDTTPEFGSRCLYRDVDRLVELRRKPAYVCVQ